MHIALGSVSLVYVTCKINNLTVTSGYYFFIFFSTIFIYCLHRIIGIEKVGKYKDKGRFRIINQYKTHIRIYASIGLIAALYFYINLPVTIQLLLLIPSFISLLYTVPILPKKRRLRDFHYIKIILIAVVWGILTVLIPEYFLNNIRDFTYLLFIERCLFIFAITIPFDIRDMEIDQKTQVKTFIHSWGSTKAKVIAVALLAFSLMIYFYLFDYSYLSAHYLTALIICYTVTSLFILYAHHRRTDYYFSGILDGTMLLMALCIKASDFIY